MFKMKLESPKEVKRDNKQYFQLFLDLVRILVYDAQLGVQSKMGAQFLLRDKVKLSMLGNMNRHLAILSKT